jgi:hypothetical protein
MCAGEGKTPLEGPVNKGKRELSAQALIGF